MSTMDFIAKLQQLDVKLTLNNGRLAVDAPEGVLSAELKSQLVANKHEIIELLSNVVVDKRPQILRQHQTTAPLSYAQSRLWFIHQLDPDSAAYNIPEAIGIEAEPGKTLNVACLTQAINDVVARHEILRTNFVLEGDVPMQHIWPQRDIEIELLDLSLLPEPVREAQLSLHIEQHANYVFDLSAGPLLAVTLVKLSAQAWVLLLNVHHIVLDGLSLDILLQQLSSRYGELSAAQAGQLVEPLPELPIQYADFALWQQSWLQGEVLQQHLHYWKAQLADTPVLSLPSDHPRPQIKSDRGARVSFVIDAALTAQLKAICADNQATLFMLGLACYQLLLSRYSGQTDFCIGTPIANRTVAQLDSLIGMFANTLPIRAQIDETLCFNQFLKHCKQCLLDAYDHQDLPLERIIDELKLVRDLSITPLFQVMFALSDEHGERSTAQDDAYIGDLAFKSLSTTSDTAKFDLSLSLNEEAGEIFGTFVYSCDLFEQASIDNLAVLYQRLLTLVANDPTKAVGQLALTWLNDDYSSFLLPDLAADLITDSNPANQFLQPIFENYTDAWALWCGSCGCTYQQLNQRIDELCCYIIAQGDDTQPIGIRCGRRFEAIVAILAVLRLGRCYVFLSEGYDQQRLQLIVAQTQLSLVISDEENLKSCSTLWSNTDNSLHLKGLQQSALKLVSTQPLHDKTSTTGLKLAAKAKDPAYIVYTSGSTGEPKGVVISYANLSAYIEAMQQHLAISEHDIYLHSAQFSFSSALRQLLLPLVSGGRCVLAQKSQLADPQKLFATIKALQVTIIDFVPSYLRLCCDELTLLVYDQCPSLSENVLDNSLRLLLSASEVLSVDCARAWYGLKQDNTPILNMYGQTETAGIVATCLVNREDLDHHGSLNVGQPLGQNRIYLLDNQRRIVPKGAVGELYIAGPTLALGYLQSPQDSPFIKSPFNHNERLYRTGDHGKLIAQGIELIGRKDLQLKIRGFRIEINEVQAQIKRATLVGDCCVIAYQDASQTSLVAFVVPTEAKLTARQIQQQLKSLMPDYMLPTRIELLAALPRNDNGKIDRQALQLLAANQNSATLQQDLPTTALEQDLLQLWQQLLGLSSLGVNDYFFTVGGHSLLAMKLANRISAMLQLDIGVKFIFQYATVKEQAEYLTERLNQPQSASLSLPSLKNFIATAVNRESRLQAPVTFSQSRLWYTYLLEPQSNRYNMPSILHLKGDLDTAALGYAFAEVIKRHDSLRTNFNQTDSGVVQVVNAVSTWHLALQDLSDLAPEIKTERLALCVDEQTEEVFDLQTDSLIRTLLIKLSAQHHVLVVTLHHIIFDGLSMDILVDELSSAFAFYTEHQNNPARLAQGPFAPMALQYSDYACWQQSILQGDKLQAYMDYWCIELETAPELLNLPLDNPRTGLQQFDSLVLSRSLTGDQVDAIRNLADQQGVTIAAILLAAFSLVLASFDAKRDVCVGLPVSGRSDELLESLLGFFVNTVVVRTEFDSLHLVSDLLTSVQEKIFSALQYQDVPLESILERLGVERSLNYNPLVQVGFNHMRQDAEANDLILGNLVLEREDSADGVALLDLSLHVIEDEHSFECAFEYNRHLFNEDSIAQLWSLFETALTAFTTNPNQSLNTVSLLSQAQLFDLLALDSHQVENILPLTPIQRDIYIDSITHPDKINNAIGCPFELNFAVDSQRLQRAFDQVMSESEIGRVQVVSGHGTYRNGLLASALEVAYLAVNKTVSHPLQVYHKPNLSEDQLEALVNQCIYRPYDVTAKGLMNHSLIQLSETRSIYVLSAHHIVMDGLALAALWARIFEYYALEQTSTGEIPGFASYITKARGDFDHPETRTFWAQHLAGVGAVNVPRPPYEVTTKESLPVSTSLTIEGAKWRAIKAYCKSQGLTPALYFKCLYTMVIHGFYRPDDDFALLEFSAGRTQAQRLSLGCFYQQTAFVAKPALMMSDAQVTDLFDDAKLQQRQIKRHKNISLMRLNQHLPTSEIKFMYNFNLLTDAAHFADLDADYLRFTGPVVDGVVSFWSVVYQDKDQLVLNLLHLANQFDDPGILDAIVHLNQQLLDGVSQQGQLSFMPVSPKPAEQQAIATKPISIGEGFAQMVARYPEHIALQHHQGEMSYRQLDHLSDGLAQLLLQHGLKPQQRVAICQQSGFDLIISLLAVIKCGAVYVPIDAKTPSTRLCYMLDDAKPQVILTDSHTSALLADEFNRHDGPLLVVDELALADVELVPYILENQDREQHQAGAYIIYTSGTTGNPKGVLVSVESVMSLMSASQPLFEFDHHDVWVLYHSFAFDFSVWEIFGALLHGGKLILVDDMVIRSSLDFCQLLVEAAVSVLNITPSAFYEIASCALSENIDIGASLHTVVFGGERLDYAQLSDWTDRYGYQQPALINMYGITETTVHVTYHRISANDSLRGASNIGKPLAGSFVVVMSANQQPVPQGVVGELYIGTERVALEYINQRALTEQKFVQVAGFDGVLYRSGDLGRLLPNGDIEYFGRIDDQVSIRGYRVELAEVESAIGRCDKVHSSCVLCHPMLPDALVAFVVFVKTDADIDHHAAVLGPLSQWLPSYMLPSLVIELEQLPLTANGKVDKKALLAYDINVNQQPEQVAPRSEVEQQLLVIWQQTIGLSSFGVTDNFFAIGGHSLTAMTVIGRIKESFAVDLPIRDVFEHPTIAHMAIVIEALQRELQAEQSTDLDADEVEDDQYDEFVL